MTADSHWGPSPFHPGSTEHRGRREDCSGPDCGPPPRIPDDWGAWCPHGKHVVVHDPECVDEWGNPFGRVVDPWPCDRCTQAEFEADQERAYHESCPSWEEIYGLH